MAKTALALAEKPAPTAAERLAALETEAQPLRLRLLEITEELTTIVPGGGSIEDEVAARRKAADLELERGVVQGRLDPIEAQIVPLRAEAKADADAAAREAFAQAGLARVEKLDSSVQKLIAEVEEFRAFFDTEGRRKGVHRSMKLRTAISELMGTITRARNLLNGTQY